MRSPWTDTTFYPSSPPPSTVYVPPQNVILTGFQLYPIQGVLANTQFAVNLNVAWPAFSGNTVYMTIVVKANSDDAFNRFSDIMFTNVPFISQSGFTVIGISINATMSSSYINKGLTGEQAVSTNPWIGSGASVWITLGTFNVPNSQQSTYTTQMNGGNMPGIFYGTGC